MAVFLIVFSIIFLITREISIKIRPFNSITGGIFSGFLAGLVGTGGAIRGMVLSAFNLSKASFISTSAFIDFGVDLSRGIVYTMNGFVTTSILPVVAGLLGVSFAGTYLGKRLLEKVSEDQFRVIVLVMILLVGSATMIKHLL